MVELGRVHIITEYASCLANPDVWLKQFNKHCGTTYYVDVHELNRLNKYFKMKPGSIGDPLRHLLKS